MKLRKEQMLVGFMFILVLIIFSFADSDTKKNGQYNSSIKHEVQKFANSNVVADSAKTTH
jgi:hypothetical protein